MKCALAFAALAAVVAGACDEDVTVSKQSDLSDVSSCTKFDGDITIDGVEGMGALNLDQLQKIKGDLIIQNMYDLQTLSLAQLTTASSFKLLNNTQLYKADIPKFTSVKDFQIITNPNLKEITYKNMSSVDNFQIINTYVSQLGAFTASKVKNIEVLSNNQLPALDFSAVKETSGYINIANNGKDTKVDMGNLTQAVGNVSFGNVAGLKIGQLKSVEDDFSLYTNSFQNLTLKSLKGAKKSITLNGNQFTAISFPELGEIGSSLNIINNTNFHSISKDTFPKLTSVPGSIVITGSFDKISFPKLDKVDGQIKLAGEGKMSCKDADDAFANVANSNIDCEFTTSSNGGSNSDNSDGENGNSDDHTSGASQVTAVGGAAMMAMAAVVAYF